MATYTIKSGETLSGIAAANNSTVDALAKFNNISDPNKIYAGSTINLPDSLPPPPSAPASIPGEQTPQQRANAFAAAGVKPVVTPSPTGGAISTADLERGTQLPSAETYASTSQPAPLSDRVAAVAGKTLTATGQSIDSLLAEREARQKADKEREQAKVNAIEGEIKTLGDKQATAAQDALAETRAKFEVDQKIKDLQSIQTKIVAAQEALDMGLIYEADRPARQSLLIGRSASLQKQGLATIGALQATAQILEGNIDLAESYAKTTIDAITTDNKNAMDALNILLSLHNEKLLTLTNDEKTTLDSRIKALQDQDKEIQKNQTDVFDLMSQYPSAAVAGGVTLLDDRATAIKKMLPKMSAMEIAKFNSSITKSTETDKDGPAEDKQQLLGLKANGMTYQEALNAFSDTLSVDWINDVYRQPSPKATTAEDQLKDAYYQSFIDPNTSGVKEGYKVTIDDKGNPVVKKDGGGTSWWNPLTWF